MAQEKNPYRFTLQEHRLSYVTLKTPKAFEEGDTPKYGVTVLIPKDHPDADKVLNKLQECYDENKSKHFKTMAMNHKNFWYPLRDGDEFADEQEAKGKDGEAYRGCYYIKAASLNQVPVYDENGEDVLELDEVKSGDYGRISMTLWPYSKKGVGITVYLNSAKKTADGEPLGSAGASHDEYDEEDEAPAPKKKTPPARTAPSASPARPAAAKAAPRPAPKIAVQWAEDQDGNPILSRDGGVNWEYPAEDADDDLPY